MFVTRLLASTCALFALSVPELCSTVTVTSNGSPSYNTWFADDLSGGATAGITTAYANNGNGSLQFTGPAGSKADYGYYFSTPFALSSLTSLSYSYYRSDSSTAAAHYDPAFRIYVTDGVHSGSLVFEPVYNGQSTSPVDQFVFANIIDADFWNSSQSLYAGANPIFTNTLADWLALYPNLQVTNFTTGIGSGWDGSFDGAVDNITYGLSDGTSTTFNFESASASPTPEPGSIFLLGTGLLSVSGAVLRRRKLPKV